MATVEPSARTVVRVVLIVVLSAFALAIPGAATVQIAVREYFDYRRLAGAGSA